MSDQKTAVRHSDEADGSNSLPPVKNATSARYTEHSTSIKRISYLLALLTAVAVSFVSGLYAGKTDFSEFYASNVPTMVECTTDTVQTLNGTASEENLRAARGHCYSLLRSQQLIDDFAIRKLNFVQQYKSNGVLLWMVVGITLSGVFLAGLQLYASYALAQKGTDALANDSEVSLKRDSLVVKSSITGLFILLISFAFFMVFVNYVYRFEKRDETSVEVPEQIKNLPRGGLGPPTKESTQ